VHSMRLHTRWTAHARGGALFRPAAAERASLVRAHEAGVVAAVVAHDAAQVVRVLLRSALARVGVDATRAQHRAQRLRRGGQQHRSRHASAHAQMAQQTWQPTASKRKRDKRRQAQASTRLQRSGDLLLVRLRRLPRQRDGEHGRLTLQRVRDVGLSSTPTHVGVAALAVLAQDARQTLFKCGARVGSVCGAQRGAVTRKADGAAASSERRARVSCRKCSHAKQTHKCSARRARLCTMWKNVV
jgi:hypothetical protein